MGSGLLAEMKAKQEKRSPFSSQKESSSSSDRTEGATSGKGHSHESRSSAISKNEGSVSFSDKVSRDAGESKPETSQRPRTSSSTLTPTSPKPPPQGTKPALAARPALPQKPRTSSVRSIDEGSDSPTGVPKGSGLRRRPSDKEGPSSLSQTSKTSAQEDISVFDTDSELDKSISRARSAQHWSEDDSTHLSRPASNPSQKSSRLNTEESGSKGKDTPANGSKDSGQSGKSSGSGEEADKDFIFI